MDSAFLIICALFLNALLAGPRSLYEKLGVFELAHIPARSLRDIERRLNREHRQAAELKARGYIVVVVAILISLLLGWILTAVFAASSPFMEIVVIALLLPVRPTIDMAQAVSRHLSSGNIGGAREIFFGTLWRHHAVMDEHALARAAIETVAVRFMERIMSGVLWYMVFGLPALFIVYIVTLLNDTLGASGGPFGVASRQAYNALSWLPSRLASGLWIVAALFVTEGKVKETAAILWPLMASLSPQALSLACIAYIQNISLGGPGSPYGGGAWIGPASPKAMPSHIKKALYLYAVLHLQLIILLGVLL